jgi:hypothetical protein
MAVVYLEIVLPLHDSPTLLATLEKLPERIHRERDIPISIRWLLESTSTISIGA